MGLSPDQLRRTYHKSRQRVLERRERANTINDISREKSRESSSPPPTNGQRERSSTTLSLGSSEFYTTRYESTRKLSTSSNLSTSSSELRGNRSINSSLTDIHMMEKHKKPTTTVIRRKKGNKLPRDPTKRLSAPLMDSLKLPAHGDNNNSVASLRKQLASMSVPDLTQHDTSLDMDKLEVRKCAVVYTQRIFFVRVI